MREWKEARAKKHNRWINREDVKMIALVFAVLIAFLLWAKYERYMDSTHPELRDDYVESPR